MPAKPESRKRQCVLVLGMHRSGTSALTGVLAKLGLSTARTPMAAKGDNPRGFWESKELWKLHDELLASAGSSWSDWRPFNPNWTNSSVADQFAHRLKKVIALEFEDAPLFVVKDPRICRFVPFWVRVLGELEIAPKAILALRHPIEVAHSLETRNGFGKKRSSVLWLRHVLDSEFSTRGLDRSFVHYGDVLDDWHAQVKRIGEELQIPWPPWSAAVASDVEQYLSADLKHHRAEDLAVESQDVSGWIGKAYSALGALANESGPVCDEALADLDEVRQDFDRASSIFGAIVSESEVIWKRRSDELAAKLAEKTRELEELAGRFDGVDKDRAKLSALVEQGRMRDAENKATVAKQRVQLAELSMREQRLVQAGNARLRALESEIELYRVAVLDYAREREDIRHSPYWRMASTIRRMDPLARPPAPAGAEAESMKLIRQSGLFDADWYLRRYADVRRNGGDPLNHYVRYGAREGRDPSPCFCTNAYLDRFPDVRESGANPLLHFITQGLREGRAAPRTTAE